MSFSRAADRMFNSTRITSERERKQNIKQNYRFFHLCAVTYIYLYTAASNCRRLEGIRIIHICTTVCLVRTHTLAHSTNIQHSQHNIELIIAAEVWDRIRSQYGRPQSNVCISERFYGYRHRMWLAGWLAYEEQRNKCMISSGQC